MTRAARHRSSPVPARATEKTDSLNPKPTKAWPEVLARSGAIARVASRPPTNRSG